MDSEWEHSRRMRDGGGKLLAVSQARARAAPPASAAHGHRMCESIPRCRAERPPTSRASLRAGGVRLAAQRVQRRVVRPPESRAFTLLHAPALAAGHTSGSGTDSSRALACRWRLNATERAHVEQGLRCDASLYAAAERHADATLGPHGCRELAPVYAKVGMAHRPEERVDLRWLGRKMQRARVATAGSTSTRPPPRGGDRLNAAATGRRR